MGWLSKSVIQIFVGVFLLLTGCISGTSDSSMGTSSTATTADLGFAGIATVENQDSSSMKITWAAATDVNVLYYRVYEIAADGTLTALAQLPKTILTYAHNGLVPNSYHTYIVRAIDKNGLNDGNIVQLTAFTYGGITSATVAGTTSVNVTFAVSGGSTTGVKIYASARGAAFSVVATAANNTTSANVIGLNSGTTYTFKVVAQSNSGVEDSNGVTIKVQTTGNTTSKYKGPMLIQAYGDAANAPNGTPSAKQIVLTWVGFAGNTSTTQYTLVRTSKGNSLDMATTTACTNTTTTSCRVCTPIGSGPQTCTDTAVAASPQAYDYAVTQYSATGWPEELPSDDSSYRMTVQVPPSNMVLVHRDSANYEQCALMSKIPDPLNHQRCVYTGTGASAYNSSPSNAPLSLAGGYFDMGYNFFVDRWTAACNWTPAATTGKCGAGAATGDCFGSGGAPANTIGAVGNVYYRPDNGDCFYKRTAGAAWIHVNNSVLISAERAIMYTVDPGAASNNHKPQLVNIDQARSWDTCQSVYNSNYGYKRLLRQREYRAMAAWRSLVGEPGAMPDSVINGMEDGSTYAHSTGNYSCNSDSHNGIASAAFNTGNLSGDVAGVVGSFTIGSLETSRCISRFGAQDHVGNVWQWVSDNLSCNTVTHTCNGTASALDSGNGPTSTFDMNGIVFNGTQGPGGTGAGQVASNYTSEWIIGSGTSGGLGSGQGFAASNFNTTLGLPMVGNDFGNALAISTFLARLHNNYFFFYTDNGNASRSLIVGGAWIYGNKSGRWTSNWTNSSTSLDRNIGFRCALPAE